MKKFLLAVATSAIVIPLVALSWKNITLVWSAPEEIGSLKQVVIKQSETNEQLKEIVARQEARQDTQEKLTALQIQALKEQLELIKDLKK